MRQCSPDEVLSMLSAGANFSHFVHMLHDANVNIGVCSMWAAEKNFHFAFQYNLSSM